MFLVGLDKIISKARSRIPKKGKRRKERLSEIKFSLGGNKTRQFILEEIAKLQLKIYLFIIDKQGRKIDDNPQNCASFVREALVRPLKENLEFEHILVDRHFTYVTQRERFNVYVQKKFKRQLFIEHMDSIQNPVITLADFVAGAVRLSYIK